MRIGTRGDSRSRAGFAPASPSSTRKRNRLRRAEFALASVRASAPPSCRAAAHAATSPMAASAGDFPAVSRNAMNARASAV